MMCIVLLVKQGLPCSKINKPLAVSEAIEELCLWNKSWTYQDWELSAFNFCSLYRWVLMYKTWLQFKEVFVCPLRAFVASNPSFF